MLGPLGWRKSCVCRVLPWGYQIKAMNSKKEPGVYQSIAFDIQAALDTKTIKAFMQVKKVAMSRAGIYHR